MDGDEPSQPVSETLADGVSGVEQPVMGKRLMKSDKFLFSRVFRLAFLSLQLVPLLYYGVTLAAHSEYKQAVRDVGATVSPLTAQPSTPMGDRA